MTIFTTVFEFIRALITAVYNFLWGDILTISLPGGSELGLSLLVLILIPAGIYFTVKTRFLPFRLFPEMIRVTLEKKHGAQKDAISGLQALIVSTATRVGMGNLVGVVAAISMGGAGAVFWMWVTALIGSATAFIEATLAQIYKEKDPLYGGYRGGPAYFINRVRLVTEIRSQDVFHGEAAEQAAYVGTDQKKYSHGSGFRTIAVLFALSGLLCWGGISQVIGNSVTSSMYNAFQIPPLWTSIVLVALAAVIVLRKNATVKVLDIVVPIMAGLYFFITIFILLL